MLVARSALAGLWCGQSAGMSRQRQIAALHARCFGPEGPQDDAFLRKAFVSKRQLAFRRDLQYYLERTFDKLSGVGAPVPHGFRDSFQFAIRP